MEFEDRTGKPITSAEFEDAIGVVTKFVPQMMSLPPELAVQMMNIRRCLQQGLLLTKAAENK
jgi:hypothetical protein